MTMWAQRDRATDNIEVTTTYGPITNSVKEDYRHLKGLRDRLSSIIEEIEAEKESASVS